MSVLYFSFSIEKYMSVQVYIRYTPPQDYVKDTLAATFNQAQGFKEISLPRSRPAFAFATFETMEDAEAAAAAMNGKIVFDHNITCEVSTAERKPRTERQPREPREPRERKPRAPREPRLPGPPSPTITYSPGLPADVEVSQLEEFYATVGIVAADIRIVARRGRRVATVFTTFHNNADQLAAIEALNGKEFLGVEFRIEASTSTRDLTEQE